MIHILLSSTRKDLAALVVGGNLDFFFFFFVLRFLHDILGKEMVVSCEVG